MSYSLILVLTDLALSDLKDTGGMMDAQDPAVWVTVKSTRKGGKEYETVKTAR
jgi:hypothetical protein